MNRETAGQIAAVMLLHGTPAQQEEAVRYCAPAHFQAVEGAEMNDTMKHIAGPVVTSSNLDERERAILHQAQRRIAELEQHLRDTQSTLQSAMGQLHRAILAANTAKAVERGRWQQWTCRKAWEDVNDPPCHPSDAGWRPCVHCAGPERLQKEQK